MDIWHRLGRICMLFLMWSMRQNEYLADKFAYRIGFGLELATVLVHIPQELRIRSRGTERHSASN